jgi:hypothetical protein
MGMRSPETRHRLACKNASHQVSGTTLLAARRIRPRHTRLPQVACRRSGAGAWIGDAGASPRRAFLQRVLALRHRFEVASEIAIALAQAERLVLLRACSSGATQESRQPDRQREQCFHGELRRCQGANGCGMRFVPEVRVADGYKNKAPAAMRAGAPYEWLRPRALSAPRAAAGSWHCTRQRACASAPAARWSTTRPGTADAVPRAACSEDQPWKMSM